MDFILQMRTPPIETIFKTASIKFDNKSLQQLKDPK